jgi:hypothetical protein
VAKKAGQFLGNTACEVGLIFRELAQEAMARDALAQINEKHYTASLDGEVVKVGVVFDFEQEKILEWASG